MAPPVLYYYPASPPVRAVLMTAKSIGLELELKQIDLMKNEHKSEWFHKINPQHSVPTFVDSDGFTVWDSHAIMAYLVSKYAGPNDSLYPKDLKKRALVDQRLHFDSGVAFATSTAIMRLLKLQLKKSIDEEDTQRINQVYSFIEKFLEGRKWIAGETVTIADFSLIPTVTSLSIFVKIDGETYPRLELWLKRAENLAEYPINKKGLEAHAILIGGLMTC